MSVLQDVKIEPVHKQLKVGLTVEEAFRLFTEGIGNWWPLHTHSVGLDQAKTCYFEGRVGGRIMEVMTDGTESEWGKVLAWKPFELITFQWYPGREPDTAQEVTISFKELETGGTLVDLVHSGWETLGDRAQDARTNYDSGWDFVLANYIIRAWKK